MFKFSQLVTMNYVIIENEAYALENLKHSIAGLRPAWQLVFTAESVEQTVAFLRSRPAIDLIFMDIELVDGTCFDIFRQVKVETPIIFTTAYDDFAIQAFKVNSVDYLLKPIGELALSEAIIKYERLTSHPNIDYQTLLAHMSRPPGRQRILISSGDTFGYVMIDDVAFFVSEDKYVYAVMRNGQRRMTNFSNLAEVEAIVDNTRFTQVSRSIIASIESIGKVSKYFNGRLKVQVCAGGEVQEAVVSAARRQVFLDWLGGK